MKVAITGATGLVGSHCTAAALAAGHDVRMVVRNPDKARSALAIQGLAHDVAEVFEADIVEPERAAVFGLNLNIGDVLAGGAIDHADGGVVRPHNPAVAPLDEGDDDGDEIAAFFGETVVLALAARRGGDALKDVVRDQPLKPFAENIPCDAEMALEIAKPARAEIGLADDQEGPPFADHVERLGEGAAGIRKTDSFHDETMGYLVSKSNLLKVV